MLWLRTLELDKKTQKQSWQVVADLDTIQALKIYSKFFFQLHQPDDNLPEKVWSVRATATAYLIAVYGSEVHNYSTMIKYECTMFIDIVCLASLVKTL